MRIGVTRILPCSLRNLFHRPLTWVIEKKKSTTVHSSLLRKHRSEGCDKAFRDPQGAEECYFTAFPIKFTVQSQRLSNLLIRITVRYPTINRHAIVLRVTVAAYSNGRGLTTSGTGMSRLGSQRTRNSIAGAWRLTVGSRTWIRAEIVPVHLTGNTVK